MDSKSIADLRKKGLVFYKKARARAAKVPPTAWVVGGLFLTAAAFMAVYTAMSAKDSTLRLKVQHAFRSAQLQVWVDGDLAYSGHLVGSGKKKLGFLPDSLQGSLSETLEVPSGAHKVKVRVAADDGTVQEDSTGAQFVRNASRTLMVTARRSDLALNWQGSSPSASDPPPFSASWFTRYASALMLTAAGSIISALTGFAVRELPGHIRSRQLRKT